MAQLTPAQRDQAREARKQANLNLISQYKTNINLVPFLEEHGFTIDEKKSSRNSPVMKNADDRTLIILKNSKSGEFIFKNPKDTHDTGNIITLATQFYQLDLSQKEGWNELHKNLSEKIGNVYFTQHDYVKPIGPTVQDKIKEGPEAVVAYFKLQPLTNVDFLVNERKIQESTVRSPEFNGKILNRPFNDRGKEPVGDKPGRAPSSGLNITFPLENEQGMLGVMNRNTGWNQIVGTKENGVWVSNFNPDVKPKEFFVAESPINCLSYHELNPPKNAFERVYIATAGQPSGTQHLTIQKLINAYKPELLVMGNDNDPSGIRFNVNMMSRLTMPEQPKTSFTMQLNSAGNTNTFIVEFDPRSVLQHSNQTTQQIKERISQVMNRGYPEDAPKAKINIVTERPDMVQIRADFPPIRSLLVRTENLVKEFRQTGQHVEIRRSVENDFNDDLKVKAEKIANKVVDPRKEMLVKLGQSPKGVPVLPTAKEIARPTAKPTVKPVTDTKPTLSLRSKKDAPDPTPMKVPEKEKKSSVKQKTPK